MELMFQGKSNSIETLQVEVKQKLVHQICSSYNEHLSETSMNELNIRVKQQKDTSNPFLGKEEQLPKPGRFTKKNTLSLNATQSPILHAKRSTLTNSYHNKKRNKDDSNIKGNSFSNAFSSLNSTTYKFELPFKFTKQLLGNPFSGLNEFNPIESTVTLDSTQKISSSLSKYDKVSMEGSFSSTYINPNEIFFSIGTNNIFHYYLFYEFHSMIVTWINLSNT